MITLNKNENVNKVGRSKKISCCVRKPTYITASAGCANDDAAVAALPDEWVPRHSGPILANYLKRREESHNNVEDDVVKEASTVNSAIDEKVRTLAENLLALIEGNQRDIDCVIDKLVVEQTANLSKDARDAALKQVFQLHTQRLEEMACFKREALVLERERTNGLRVILRDKFQNLVAIGHRPPKELLHEFDDKVYEINQQLLSNSRAYTELEAELRVQADESVVRARSTINQLSLGVPMTHCRQSALPYTGHRDSQRRPTSAYERHHESDASISQIIKNVENFDEYLSKLVQTYKLAVMKVFSGFNDKLNVLEKDLGTGHHQYLTQAHDIHALTEFKQLLDKTLLQLSFTLNKKQIASKDLLEATDAHLLSMQRSLWSLGECLQDTFIILYEAGHLWDAHILRQAFAQKLTVAAVEDLLTSNDSQELANEVAYNVALEQLRNSSDYDKLHQQYEGVLLMLHRTAELYLHHSEAELGRLEEFMNLPTPLSDILLAEFGCFLEKHPRGLVNSRNSGTGDNGSLSSIPRASSEVSDMTLPRLILQTGLQEVALKNWRDGFLESFENNMSRIPIELKHQAKLWVEERANSLHVRYNLKMLSHSIRVERVKAAYESRCAELQIHETRLQSHIDAIYDLMDVLTEEASLFASMDNSNLYPIESWIDRMHNDMLTFLRQENINPETMRLKFSSYAPRLNRYRSLFEDSLNNAVENYKQQIDCRIQNARIANVRFMAHMKLFHEGGRYSAQEATRASLIISKGAEATESCKNRVIDALNHRRLQLLSIADSRLAPLYRIIDDNYKAIVKDQKKPPPVEKKKGKASK